MRFLIGISAVLVSWSIVEPGMYFIAACLLSLRPILAQIARKWRKSPLYHGNLSKDEYGRHSSIQGLCRTELAPARSGFKKVHFPQSDQAIAIETAFFQGSVFPGSATLDHDVEQSFTPSSQPHGIRVDKELRVTASRHGDVM